MSRVGVQEVLTRLWKEKKNTREPRIKENRDGPPWHKLILIQLVQT